MHLHEITNETFGKKVSLTTETKLAGSMKYEGILRDISFFPTVAEVEIDGKVVEFRNVVAIEEVTEEASPADEETENRYNPNDEILVIFHALDNIAFYVTAKWGNSETTLINNAVAELKRETGLDLRELVDDVYKIAEIDY